jgi:hypothetical protein
MVASRSFVPARDHLKCLDFNGLKSLPVDKLDSPRPLEICRPRLKLDGRI